MRILALAIGGLVSATTAAQAGGDALVIGNSTYNGVQTLFAATQVAEAAGAMRAQGFDVTEANDANGTKMKQGFADFVGTLDDDGGPVVVLLAGAFLHSATGAYLLPATDGAALADQAVMVEAFPIDAPLSVLAKYPGRAFLVLSESAVAADYGDFLEAGLGELNIPSGVTVLHGPESAVSRFASGGLTSLGQPLVESARAAGLTVKGYAASDLVVVRASDVPGAAADSAVEKATVEEAAPAPEPMAEAELTPQPMPEAAPESAAVAEPSQVSEVAPQVAEEVAPVTPSPPEEVVTAEPEPMMETAEGEAMEEAAPAIEAGEGTMAEAKPAMEAGDEAMAEVKPGMAAGEEAMAEAVPEVDTRSEVEIAADEAAWRAARIQNSEESYQSYLVAQPDGVYANAANQRIKAIKADPFYDLRRAEDFLRLDREARRQIQRDLDTLGHYHWGVDGIFGDGTRDAVRAWQKADNREATGYLDLNQIAALDRQATAAKEARKQESARRAQTAAAEAKRKREQAAAAAQARKEAEAAATPDATEAPRRAGPSDQAMWAEVERLGSEQAVRRYLNAYPNGARATRARQMLEVIERMRGG